MRTDFILFVVITCFNITTGTTLSAQSISPELPICTTYGYHHRPEIATNGNGGAFFVWLEESTCHFDIFMQMIDRNGDRCWNLDGKLICAETGCAFPKIISNNTGEAIVIWPDDRNGVLKIYGQRINQSGYTLWESGGIPLSDNLDWVAPNMNVIPDGFGGGILACIETSRLLMYRFDSNGTSLWSINGIEVSSSVDCSIPPKMIADGDGGAIVTWGGGSDHKTRYKCFIQKIERTGALSWSSSGVEVGPPVDWDTYPAVASNNSGGAYVVWWGGEEDYRRLCIQKIDSNGNHLWVPEGIPIGEQCLLEVASDPPAIIEDKKGGVFVAWHGCNTSKYVVCCQHVDIHGNILWEQGGVFLTDGEGNKLNVQLIEDGNGGVVVSWTEWVFNPDLHKAIYAQQIDSFGNVLWGESGLQVCLEEGERDYSKLLLNEYSDAIITWEDYRYFHDDFVNIYAKIIELDPVPISVQLMDYSVEVCKPSVILKWTLQDGCNGEEFRVLQDIKSEAMEEYLIEVNDLNIIKEGCRYLGEFIPVESGRECKFLVEYYFDGKWQTLFVTDPVSIPQQLFRLEQNHPNPFNPTTIIKYYLPESIPIILEIFDVSGKRVATLVNEVQEKGPYSFKWNGKDTEGNLVSSGVYIYRLKAGKEVVSKKMVLLR